MTEPSPDVVTLDTLHDDLRSGFADMGAGLADLKTELQGGFTELKTEMRAGFADLKATLISGFRSLPTRETSEEMVRLLREGNRLQDERFTQLDLRTREQHLETQQVLHALVEGQRQLVEGQRQLVEGQRQLVEGQRQLVEGQQALAEGQRDLSADIRALIARIDALIRGRGNGDRTG